MGVVLIYDPLDSHNYSQYSAMNNPEKCFNLTGLTSELTALLERCWLMMREPVEESL
jgi:hypothetical protein